MAASIALLCFLLILNQSSSLVSASVQETCKMVARNSRNINYNFCVTSLSADPKSSSADTQGLAVIATNLAGTSATSTQSTIYNLLDKTSDHATMECLSDCLTTYSYLVNSLKYTVSAITSKRYSYAKSHLSAAVDVGDFCEHGFAELKVKSPLTKENKDSAALSALALVITSLLG